jgi:ABC-type branched-subunit amino acid transport system substrate-binding protein
VVAPAKWFVGALLLATAACGSTVPVVEGASGGGVGSADSTGGAPAGTTGGPPVPASGAATAGTGARSATGGATTGAVQGPGSSGAGVPSPAEVAGAAVPGVTATTLTVGAVYTPDQNAVAQSVGVDSVNTQGAQSLVNVVVDDINAQGGIGGRKLKLVWHARPIQSAETYDSLDQQACAAFTEDNHVFAALGSAGGANFRRCVMKAGAAVIAGGYSTSVDSTARSLPYLIESNALSWSRQMRALITSVHDGGYFTPGYKLGVLAYDSPNGREVVSTAIRPTLARYGLKATDYQYLPPNKSFADNGPAASQLQNIVLRFQTEGITHVLMTSVDGGLPLIFSRMADSQQYRPRYAVTSQWGLSAVSGDYAPGQLRGAMGISWIPPQDFLPEDDPTRNLPLRRKCIALYKSRGISQNNAADLDAQLAICWVFWHFRDSVEAAGGVLTRDALMRGTVLLGQVAGTDTDVTRLTRTRHDGVGAVRPVAYVESCTCFRATGRLRSIP